MLRFLGIARLAIIDSVDIEFGPGLNVLTGETGAGKSIVVGAVELLLGGRASADLVRSGEDAAQVQAVLETPDGREVIVRREVSASGRSRAFVDGALVTSGALREITAPLVDLHGQHDHQALLDPLTHLDLLDRFGGLDGAAGEVAAAFTSWTATRQALDACRMDERERRARLDLIDFQLAEIDRVAPVAGEDDELAATRAVLASADRVQRLCTEAYDALYEGEGAIVETLGRVWRRVAELAAIDPQFGGFDEARVSVHAQLDEVARLLRHRVTHLDASPERLQAVEDRLAALERVKRRHGPTLADVLRRRAALAAEREALSTSGDRATTLERELETCRNTFVVAARQIARQRREAAARMGRAVAGEMSTLAMPGATCEFRFESGELPEGRWSARGIDAGELFLSANPGEAPRPLARIASGGELSRVMLGLKTLASLDQPGKTLIFDEVDAGIGGAAAGAVGERLRRLGERFQVLCITHLPQVAAHAHRHYRVAKAVRANRTVTSVEPLTPAEQVREVARMMGGRELTPGVLEAARELLEHVGESEQRTKGESEGRQAKAKARGRK